MHLMLISWQCKIFQKAGLNLDHTSFTLQSLEKAVNSKHLYLEGVHWKKGELLGTGAYSSCYAVRDLMNGSLMAVKQVNATHNPSGQSLARFLDFVKVPSVCRWLQRIICFNFTRFFNYDFCHAWGWPSKLHVKTNSDVSALSAVISLSYRRSFRTFP